MRELKTNPVLGLNLVEVLDTLEGVPSSLIDKLNWEMADTNEDLEAEGVSSVSISHENSEQEIVFSTVSHKWNDVAISLGLQPHEIAECNAGSSIRESLYK